MKTYRVIQGIILLIALHLVPGTLMASDPLGSVAEIAILKPTVVTIGDTTYTATSGDRLHVSKPGALPIIYDVSKDDAGNITFSSSEGDITCSTSANTCSDAGFQAAVSAGLPGVASSGGGGPKFVIVSAKVPGSSCTCYVGGTEGGETCPSDTPVDQIKYKCEVGEGLSGFQDMFASIIRYTVNIVLILSVLAIIGLGIAWTMAGGDDIKAKSSLKSWAINICIGLIILFFFRYILQFFAPWIYK